MKSSYYLLLLPIGFFYLAYKNKNNKLFLVLSCFYGIGGIFAYILTLQPLFKVSSNFGFQDFSLWANIYLFICCYILFYPIIKEKSNYGIVGKINSDNLKLICKIYIFISLLYCIFIFPHIEVALNVVDAAAFHNEMLEDGLDISGGSAILEKLFSFQEHLRPLGIFLFCYILGHLKNNNGLKYTYAIFCILPPMLESLATSHRNVVVFMLIDFFLSFVVFYSYYTNKIKKIVTLISLVIGIFTVCIVVVFALIRFSDTAVGDMVSYSLYRYIGEPFVDFNTMLWQTDKLLYGNKSFTTLLQYLGFDYVPVNEQREYYIGLPYIISFFYTAIGNFYMDFGCWGAIIICIIISSFFYLLLNKRLKYNSLTRVLILYLYVSFTIKNYFYFVFMGANNILFIWYCIFVYLIYRFVDIPLKKHC